MNQPRPADSTPRLRLGAVDRALLAVLAEVGDIDTEQASLRVAERLRGAGESFSLVSGRPWFGLESSVRLLVDLGAAELDVGMATLVAPGSPTPTTEHFYLSTSVENLRDALGRVEHIGDVRIERTKTTGANHKVVPCWVVTVELVCGRVMPTVVGEGPTEDLALSDALDRALARRAQGDSRP